MTNPSFPRKSTPSTCPPPARLPSPIILSSPKCPIGLTLNSKTTNGHPIWIFSWTLPMLLSTCHPCHQHCQIWLPHPQWSLTTSGPPIAFLQMALDLCFSNPPSSLLGGHHLLLCLHHLHLVCPLLTTLSLTLSMVHPRQNSRENQHYQPPALTQPCHPHTPHPTPNALPQSFKLEPFLLPTHLFKFSGQSKSLINQQILQGTGLG